MMWNERDIRTSKYVTTCLTIFGVSNATDLSIKFRKNGSVDGLPVVFNISGGSREGGIGENLSGG